MPESKPVATAARIAAVSSLSLADNRPRSPISRPFNESEFALLDQIRNAAGRARCARRVDPQGVRAILGEDGPLTAMSCAEALARALHGAFGRAPVFFRPGERELSADEAWLLRLVLSLAAGDRASAGFLAGRRLPAAMRRPVLFLAAECADRLESF